MARTSGRLLASKACTFRGRWGHDRDDRRDDEPKVENLRAHAQHHGTLRHAGKRVKPRQPSACNNLVPPNGPPAPARAPSATILPVAEAPSLNQSFLVTAGSTREPIDQVRVWGNVFTGDTGFAIARELARHARVDLLTSNQTHLQQIAADPGLAAVMSVAAFQSHADLRALLAERIAQQTYRGVFMTAAVSDYRPAVVVEVLSRQPLPDGNEQWTVRSAAAPKVKSSYDEIAVLGERTAKLVDLFRTEWGYNGLLVKFKLEVGIAQERLLEIGRASRRASSADYLVANTLAMVEGPGAGAFVIGPDDEAEFVPRSKLPSRMARLAMDFGS